jgi:hypothetical protein
MGGMGRTTIHGSDEQGSVHWIRVQEHERRQVPGASAYGTRGSRKDPP